MISLQELLQNMRQQIVLYDTEQVTITAFELRIEELLHVKRYEATECVFMILLRKVTRLSRKYGQKHDIIDQLLVKKQLYGVEMIGRKNGTKMLPIFTTVFR